MSIADKIRDMSVLPSRFNIMLEQALYAVSNGRERDELAIVACVVSGASWRFWQAWRLPEDNRQAHEWVVFSNVMKIAESEKLSITEKRIATVFCFTHDTFFIKRIMESEIFELEEKGFQEKADELRRIKKDQLKIHMDGGAKNTDYLLKQLKHPNDPTKLLLSVKEIDKCVEIVKKHDMWKVEPPEPPPTENRLALACLEGDVLWPMHPIGILADLERPNKGKTKDFTDPAIWYEQLKQSLRTLIDFRPKWENAGIPKGDFIDNKSIFRTKEGHRLYTEWRKLWNLI